MPAARTGPQGSPAFPGMVPRRSRRRFPARAARDTRSRVAGQGPDAGHWPEAPPDCGRAGRGWRQRRSRRPPRTAARGIGVQRVTGGPRVAGGMAGRRPLALNFQRLPVRAGAGQFRGPLRPAASSPYRGRAAARDRSERGQLGALWARSHLLLSWWSASLQRPSMKVTASRCPAGRHGDISGGEEKQFRPRLTSNAPRCPIRRSQAFTFPPPPPPHLHRPRAPAMVSGSSASTSLGREVVDIEPPQQVVDLQRGLAEQLPTDVPAPSGRIIKHLPEPVLRMGEAQAVEDIRHRSRRRYAERPRCCARFSTGADRPGTVQSAS